MQFARPDKPAFGFVRTQGDLDVGPNLFPYLLGDAGQHLMKCAERLSLEAHALRGRREPQRRAESRDADIAEAGRDQNLPSSGHASEVVADPLAVSASPAAVPDRA